MVVFFLKTIKKTKGRAIIHMYRVVSQTIWIMEGLRKEAM